MPLQKKAIQSILALVVLVFLVAFTKADGFTTLPGPNKPIGQASHTIYLTDASDIVVTDIRMDDVSGIEILEYIRKKSLRTKVIMITGYATLEVARESLTKGAFDFIAKPFKIKEIRKAIEKAAEALRAEDNR